MPDFIPLPDGQRWPLELAARTPVCFRTLGRLLANMPWCNGLLGADYSYADHLLLLAKHVKKATRLEALLLHAHRPLTDSSVLPVVRYPADVPKLEIHRAPHPSIHENTVRFQIRHAAEIDQHPSEDITTYLKAAESSVIQAELRDLSHSIPRTSLLGAVKTTLPITPMTREAAAAEWADQVEQRIPRLMALREAI